ncbi:hypothetical protein EU527_10825 [Candidatus Thorarchaeota archaeon]|nr:MAG: hypothetical protein EU527_10825 [Candidatus Thorarchaeota archaeon]
MKLFSDYETKIINDFLKEKTGSFLIAFRNKHGPTKLKELWTEFLAEIAHPVKCLSWWSSGGNVGLLECETENGLSLYGQWVLDDDNRLLNIMEINEEDIVNIRDGFDAGAVISSEMRAIRIGESGGEKE